MSERSRPETAIALCAWSSLEGRKPIGAQVANIDLLIVRYDDQVSVLYGRCLHRGALLVDGHISGDNIICGLHNWDFRYDTGVSEYDNHERLEKFSAWVAEDQVWVDESEIAAWADEHPQPFPRDAYQGDFADTKPDPAEPWTSYINELAEHGLSRTGHHGAVSAMGVSREELPTWEDIQFVTAQLSRMALLDDEPVASDVVIGPNAAKPLRLAIPLFVSDMSFGALSHEAKVALAKGAELAGTGICSGEGGMLPAEQEANSRYLYEYASGRFGWDIEKVKRCQAFHFKCGQGAKTGTCGHLPGHKVTPEIAAVRGIEPGTSAISPARFPDWDHLEDYKRFADTVREATGGIPIGVKLSAQRVEADLEAALSIGVDYVILDGRGGGTGAAPNVLRNHISVPTIPALARARRYLDSKGAGDVSLIITGGLRTASDFAKALAMGADAIAVSNAALQAIGCLGMRACHTNNCPVGIATQKEHLRARLPVDHAAERLGRFFTSVVELMKIISRACGRSHLSQLDNDDLTTWKKDMAELAGVPYGGVG
jgi:glutamate synthase domain-containing protein 2/nitrite reductase/ring-hydroxylating ferredoxin subunit